MGFRTGPGLRDRVIYRELFPFGLTVADISPTVRPIPVSLTHIAARQELRSIMSALGLGAWTGEVADRPWTLRPSDLFAHPGAAGIRMRRAVLD